MRVRGKMMRGMERAMFFKEDTTFNDIRDKSLQQWLDEMEQHEDVAVRGGVKLTREYVQYLKDEIGVCRTCRALGRCQNNGRQISEKAAGEEVGNYGQKRENNNQVSGKRRSK